MRRLVLALLLAASITAAGFVGFLFARSDPSDPVDETIPTETAEVRRTDLVQTETLDGTLGFGSVSLLKSSLAGTLTGLPDEASALEPGSIAMEIDGLPVIVFRGERPAWRSLSADSDDGPDIRQLEENLAALGLGEDGDWEPDAVYDDITEAAIEDLRVEYGLPDVAGLELGRILFLPESVRVGAAVAALGDQMMPGSPVVEYTGFEQVVTIELDPTRLDLVHRGDAVTVTLPDDRQIDGMISDVGRTVVPSGPEPDAAGVVEVLVGLVESTEGLDQAPVEVEVESERATGVLAVPVRALIALSDGGYAVEVDGRLIGVEIGDFAGGLVEVSGALQEGDLVVVPQ